MKALGLGLRKGLDTFEFDLANGIDLKDVARGNQDISFYSFRLANDYHLSLCELAEGLLPPGLFNVDSELACREIKPL